MGTATPLPRLRSLAFLLILAGCAPPLDPGAHEDLGKSALPIQGGYGDQRDLAVVGLAVTDSGGHIIRTCSGSLIAPNLVLTAQHCIANTPRYVSCDRSVFGAAEPASRVFITQSESLWSSDAAWLPVAEVLPPPGRNVVCGRDVALLLLDTMVSEPVAELAPRLSSLAAPGDSYSAIGFGATGQDEKDAGHRRRRDRLKIVCVGETCGTSGQVEGREWRGDHGICNGDSGGPAIDAEGRVIGVTSRGPSGCDDPIYGGLTGFKGWIQGEALRAARAGSYTAAPWTRDGVPSADPDDDARAQGGMASCAISVGGEGSSGGAVFVLALIAAMALLRRHESGAHRSV